MADKQNDDPEDVAGSEEGGDRAIDPGDTWAANDTPVVEVSFEALEEDLLAEQRESELDEDGPVDTQHSDGSASTPMEAQDYRGLVYTPPDEPPILPSDSPEGIEIVAGFGKDLEEDDDPREQILPPTVADNDLDLQEKILYVLRHSSETNRMPPDVQVEVEDGIVYLTGQVETLDDVDLVSTLVQDIEGVVDVEEDLTVASL